MARLALGLVLASLVSGASALADPIPYGNPGTIAPTSTFTATATGDLIGYFAGSSAGDTDFIRLVDVTSGFTSANFFNNQTTVAGTPQNFGHVNAGDVLVFELYNQSTNQIFATDPSRSADGVNHGYATAFAGPLLNGVPLPAGVYVGMEDLPNGASDFDYNDDTFIFTNVSRNTAVTPEPGSLMLLSTGILGAAGILRRRVFSR